ncbi:MAG: YlxM family DNA-binding protein [Roseburia sp.]|nr:YlxM family DNA-binding protein [Ruminococcus sp.]MCM1155993.1 YlxM family DNA-binding protein [Roseburia sp.]MCM1242787.1 YlxM family DNA-binding protein [Roseburia sp.]
MEKIVEQGLLYDFYGELLTEHQKQIYEGIVYENLSLGEIATEQGISRQGVHDIVKRCDKALSAYEEKLQLVARFMKIRERIREIDALTEDYEQDKAGDKAAYCRKLRRLSAEILKEL